MYVFDYWFFPACSFIGTFFITSHILAILDIYQPQWYKSREISPRPPVTYKLYMKVIPKTILNFLLAVVVGAILWHFRITRKPELPSLPVALSQLVICYFFAELSFWSSHYIAHHPFLYKRVHSQHHMYPRPIGLVAIYCSHWEMIIVNIPLAIVMPIVLQMHPLINSIWSCGLAFYIVMIHCGHNLIPKCILDSNYHDQHHLNSKGNYGSYMLDALFETTVGKKKSS